MLLISTPWMKKKHFLRCTAFHTPACTSVLVLGDFNARVGANHQVWRTVIGRHGVGKGNNNGLLEVCSEFSLCITNTMFQLQNKFNTWMHPRSKHWHLIDFVMVRRSDLWDVKITRAMRGADCWKDHCLIRSELSMRVRPPPRMKQPCKRLNTNALLTEEARGNFQRTLNHQLEEFSKPSEGPPDETTLIAEWESITDTILSTEIHLWRHAQATSRLVQCQPEGNPRYTAEKNSAYKAHLEQPKYPAHYQRWIRIRS